MASTPPVSPRMQGSVIRSPGLLSTTDIIPGRVYGVRSSIEALSPSSPGSPASPGGSTQSQKPRPRLVLVIDVAHNSSQIGVVVLRNFGGKPISHPDVYPGTPKDILYKRWLPIYPVLELISDPDYGPLTFISELRKPTYAFLERTTVDVTSLRVLQITSDLHQGDSQRLLDLIARVFRGRRTLQVAAAGVEAANTGGIIDGGSSLPQGGTPGPGASDIAPDEFGEDSMAMEAMVDWTSYDGFGATEYDDEFDSEEFELADCLY